MESVILALGSVNADFQVRVKDGFDMETSAAHDFRRFGGGKAANVAYLARMLGQEAWLFGRLGDDDLNEQALAPLRSAGVELSGVTRASGHATAVAMIMVPPSGKKRIVLANNANDSWSDDAVAGVCRGIEHAPSTSALVVDCEVPTPVVKRAAYAARGRGMPVVLDPSFPDRVDGDLLANVDAITPNESEARHLGRLTGSGRAEVGDIAHALSARGPKIVCIKLEDGGCLLVEPQGEARIPAEDAEAVDTTGAGDAFTGALAVALLEGRSAQEAARFAVSASTLAVTGYGSQPSYPRRDAIEDHLRAARLRFAGRG